MTGEVEVEVGVEEEVEIGVWRPPVGARAGVATRVSEPILPVRVPPGVRMGTTQKKFEVGIF